MIQFNQDAYGQVIRVNFGEDISAATAFTLELLPQYGDQQDLTPTLGTSDADVGDQTYLANQFVYYTTTSDMFPNPLSEIWKKKATATISATVVKATQYTDFRVTP